MATNEMKGTQAFQDTIQAYLDRKAENDALFAVKYANPSKSVSECCAFIFSEVQKLGVCGLTDDEVYGIAVHFYEESEVSAPTIPNCRVVVNHMVELTEEEKAEARQKAIDQLQREEADRLRRKAERPKAQQPQQTQPSLFDF